MQEDMQNEKAAAEQGLGAEQASTSKTGLDRRQLAFAGIAAMLCIVLIVGSAWSLMSGPGPQLGPSAHAQGSTIAEGDASIEEGNDEGSATDGGSKGHGGATASVAGDGSKGDKVGTQGDAAAEASGADDRPATSGGAGGHAESHGGSGATPSTPGQGSQKPAPRTVTVTISADGSVGGGGVAGPITLTFEEGATAYDALIGAGWPVMAEQSAMGVYVTSINGVAAGPKTGWTYAVNGALPNYACSAYTLADGDVITWKFVEVK